MRLILFDVDGTLVDSERVLLESQRRALARHGLAHPGRAAGLTVVGLSLALALETLVREVPGGTDVDIDALADTYREVFFDLRQDPAYDSPLFEGVGETIHGLLARGDVLLGLVTGKSRRGVEHLVARHGWDKSFATIQTADTNPSKPAPDMVLAALRETYLSPERALVVGDTTYDMEMARAAGADAVGVAWGFHPPEKIAKAGARIVIERMPALLELIEA